MTTKIYELNYYSALLSITQKKNYRKILLLKLFDFSGFISFRGLRITSSGVVGD